MGINCEYVHYCSDVKEAALPGYAEDDKMAAKLWKMSADLVGLKDDETA